MTQAPQTDSWIAAAIGSPPADSEPALAAVIATARDGDAGAFQTLMQLTERGVYRIGLRMTGSHADAQDVVQETYLRVFRHLGRYRDSQPFRPWLYRIALNVCRDQLRSRKNAPEAPLYQPQTEEPSREPSAERQASAREESELLAVAVRRLPAKERAAVILRDVEGLDTVEVAKILNSRPATVRSQIASARRKLTEARDAWQRSVR